jgi:hypothetical protein
MTTDRWQSDLERIQREMETECRDRPGPERTAAEMIGDALWHLRHQQPEAASLETLRAQIKRRQETFRDRLAGARPSGLDPTIGRLPRRKITHDPDSL